MTDQRTVRIVLYTLAFVLVASVAGELGLAFLERAIPDQIDRLANIALGAVASILVRTSSEPQEVQVMNQPADPVPVDDAGQGG